MNLGQYVDSTKIDVIGFGKSFFIGKNEFDCIKLDIYYTDKFIRNSTIIDSIRMASIDDIIAMKVDVIARNGRKKDFWDLHEFLDHFSLEKILSLHKERYPITHDKEQIILNFLNFKFADEDFDPICLKYKYWEVIKLDFVDFIKNYNSI